MQDKLEKLSVGDALRAVRFAEVVVVLLDATIPFEKQDLSIVDLIEQEGRAIVIGLIVAALVVMVGGAGALIASGAIGFVVALLILAFPIPEASAATVAADSSDAKAALRRC